MLLSEKNECRVGAYNTFVQTKILKGERRKPIKIRVCLYEHRSMCPQQVSSDYLVGPGRQGKKYGTFS